MDGHQALASQSIRALRSSGGAFGLDSLKPYCQDYFMRLVGETHFDRI